MIHSRFFLIGSLLVLFAGCLQLQDNREPAENIIVEEKMIAHFDREDASRSAFGDLVFLGGLELTSSNPNFGGISACIMQQDGRHFLALTDHAYWMRGRIVYADNRPVSITDVEIAPVIGPDGKHAADWDMESIAVAGDSLYAGVEGLDRIPIFVWDTNTFPRYRNEIPFPEGVKVLPPNGGLEALAFIANLDAPGKTLLAISEKGQDAFGNAICYMFDHNDRSEFSVVRKGQYDISDAAVLPNGDLIILERKYDIETGVAIRLRQIPRGLIKPEAAVDGPVLMEADIRYQLDNMEALGVHRSATGATILTLMSDNNFSPSQRTLLLQFALKTSAQAGKAL